MARYLILSLSLLLLPACGGKEGNKDPSAQEKPTANTGSKKVWDPSLGTGGIKGVVKFDGDAPKRRAIDMSKEDHCAANKVTDESIIVNDNGTLANCVVWIKKGLDSWSFPEPTEPAVLNQEGCQYKPHILVVRVNQTLKIKNFDPMMHNIHMSPKKNRKIGGPLNWSQKQGQEDSRRFKRKEMVRLICDVHTWMRAYIAVVDSPFAAITGSDGSFELKNVPHGEYTIEVWHEVFGKKKQVVTVTDNKIESIEFSFKED